MSEEKDHKTSTIWNAKLRAKRTKKRRTIGRRRSITEEIAEGHAYFWNRRKFNPYNNT